MNKISTYLISTLLSLALLSACGGGTQPFNQCGCRQGEDGHGWIAFEMEGEEEKLQGFTAALQQGFGTAQLSFLHYPQETYQEYFDPGYHALDPERLPSPFGVQKIMVWDGFCRLDWFPDTLQMSVQVKEHRMGRRPIDPWACSVELRLRNAYGHDLLTDCRRASPVQQSLQALVEKHLGEPHDTTPNPNFPAMERNWNYRKADFARRVQGFLDPKCYPAISHFPGANAFRIQLCEREDMKDTLTAKVEVLSEAGDLLPFLMYDIITDSMETEVRILNGVSGYRIYFEDLEEVSAIWFRFRDGRKLKFYEKGDYTRYPLPFKPRYSPQRQRQRREEELNQRLRPKERIAL